MSDNSAIHWTDATWNPVRGCSRVSAGCQNCYAERMAARFTAPDQWGHGYAEHTPAGPRWTGKVKLIPEMLDRPPRWRKPRRIFVNSTSDLFHEELSDEDIAAVFGVMAACPQHTFQVLTKRPERMRQWFERMAFSDYGPDVFMVGATTQHMLGRSPGLGQIRRAGWPLHNVWLGVSVEDQATADERIPLLLQTPAAVRFVSAEPLLDAIDLGPFLWAVGASTAGPWYFPSGRVVRTGGAGGQAISSIPARELHWVISGGESGAGCRPADPDWFRSIRDQCEDAGVAYFHKQHGGGRMIDGAWGGRELDGRTHDDMPEQRKAVAA